MKGFHIVNKLYNKKNLTKRRNWDGIKIKTIHVNLNHASGPI
jgi:hypothetical protein